MTPHCPLPQTKILLQVQFLSTALLHEKVQCGGPVAKPVKKSSTKHEITQNSVNIYRHSHRRTGPAPPGAKQHSNDGRHGALASVEQILSFRLPWPVDA
jgi:hypothetical protein